MSSIKSIVMGHPTLNQNVRNTAQAFANAGVLKHFHTTINTTKINFLPKGKMFDEVARRALPRVVSEVTSQHPLLEVRRLIGSRLIHKLNLPAPSIHQIYEQIDRAVARSIEPSTTLVYGYEDGSRISFSKATVEGVETIYDLPTGYWRAKEEIFKKDRELSERWWGATKSYETPHKHRENKDLEISLSSKIIVASKFTAETLKLAPFELPVPKVVPYGSGSPSRNIAPKFGGNRKLELLYVGAITQRKGLSYLFDALKPLRNFCNLTIIGMDHSESQVLSQSANQQSWFRSLPHEAVLAKMKTSDLLVFPSIFEGFGLVITEALSQGLPVLTTTNTAGPDLISQGKNGWIVDPHGHRQIQEVLENILMGQANLDDMKEHAYLGSQSRSWAIYQSEILDAIL